MAKKISELPSTTTPPSTVEIAVVDGGVTKKTTSAALATALIRSNSGWYDVGHNAGVTGSIGATTSTQILVDGLASTQGGFAAIPDGTTELGLYDKATSKILLAELALNAFLTFQATGTYTTVSANTDVTLVYNFYNAAGSLVFARGTDVFFKNTGAHAFAFSIEAFLGAPIVGGHVKLFVEFDTGATNTVTMGGILVKIEK